MNIALTLNKSVRGFFGGVNWENRPQVVSSSPVGAASVLSFRLSVRDYFNQIPWSGIPIAAAPTPQPSPADVEEKQETLEDFLDDISSFF
jgi:hypothetical protein